MKALLWGWKSECFEQVWVVSWQIFTC